MKKTVSKQTKSSRTTKKKSLMKLFLPLLALGFLVLPLTIYMSLSDNNLFARAAASYTAGVTTIGKTTDSGNSNAFTSTQVTTGVNPGTLSSISVYVGSVHAAPRNHMQVAIYADNGSNRPGAFIASSTSQVLKAKSWNTFPMPATAVAPNTKYWLGFNVDGSNTQYPFTRVSTARSAWKFSIPYGTWPNPLGTLADAKAEQYSIYMTYAAVPSPTVTPTLTPVPTQVPSQEPTPTMEPTTAPTPGPSTGPALPVKTSPGKGSAFWFHLNSTAVTDAMLATEAKRRKFIILNSWESSYIPKLKAANPNVMVLVYKDLSSTRDYACRNGVDDAELPAGVGYCYANTNHPEWFLKAPNGSRLSYDSYGGHWQMDIGNPDYQRTWINNVKESLLKNKFDGVMMDNALYHCDTYHDGTCPVNYPTDESFRAAYKSMMAAAKTELNAAGIKTVANLNGARLIPGIWNSYMEHLDGGYDEFWLAFDTNNYLPEYGNPSVGWKAQVDEIISNEAQGKFTIVQPHFRVGDTRGFRFTYASYLMANGGYAAYSEIAATDAYSNPPVWHPEFDWDLGAPTNTYFAVKTNVFRRDFTCGAVIVNANTTSSAATAIPLNGTYLNESGASVTSVSLAGTSGSILRKPNCTP